MQKPFTETLQIRKQASQNLKEDGKEWNKPYISLGFIVNQHNR